MSRYGSVYGDVRAALGLDEPRPAARRAARAPRRSGPQHAPRVPFALLVVTLIAGGLGLLLLLNTASAANEVRRHDLAARDASVAAQLQELQNEVAASAAPANLAAAAGELGMVPAGNPAFLVVGPDGSVKVMGRPARVTDAALAIPAKTSPKPSKTPSKTPTSTPGKTSTNTSTNTRTNTSTNTSTNTRSNTRGNSAGRTAGRQPGPSPSSPSRTPTPTSTPTPTVVLPGGER